MATADNLARIQDISVATINGIVHEDMTFLGRHQTLAGIQGIPAATSDNIVGKQYILAATTILFWHMTFLHRH